MIQKYMNSKIGASLNFNQNLKAELQIFKSLGYDYAELGIGSLKSFEKNLKKIIKNFPILTLHLPQTDYKESEIEICKKAMEISTNYGINLFVIHLYSINLLTKNNLELKIKALHELSEFAQNRDAILTLENTEEDIMTLNNVFNAIPKLNFCLDIGHANLFAEKNQSVDLINNFGNILKHIHIHDNLGGYSEADDTHLPVGAGNIEFTPIFEKLKDINYTENITVESRYKPTREERELSIKEVKNFLANLI